MFNKKYKKYKKIIENSKLFDSRFYLKTYRDARQANETPLDHFIKVGLKEDRKPNEWFDPVWYKGFYEDIKNSKETPFIHYIVHGMKEFRFANEGEKKEYETLKGSFDTSTYKNSYEDLQKLGDDFDFLWHYVHFGKNEGRDCFFLNATNTRMFNKAIDQKSISNIITSLNDIERHEYHIIRNSDIDFSSYFEINDHPFCSNDPIIDYIKSWKKHTPVIPSIFDTTFYLLCNPDIKTADINPLVHYLTAGKKEGRTAQFDKSKILKGGLAYKNDLETIIFVSHESSASGAPLLGYNIIKLLSKKYNIINIVIRKKEIHDDFLSYSCEMLTSIEKDIYGSSLYYLSQLKKKHNIKSILLNSIVTHPILEIANKLSIPSVLLVHEFSDYTKPVGTMRSAVINADYVVVPAKIISSSIMEDIQNLSSYTIDNDIKSIKIFPQGKLPEIPGSYGQNDSIETLYKKLHIADPKNTKIIVGSGWVQPRKGVDLFIATAKYIKKNYDGSCKFVWVGDGFEPETDLAYSVWLQREIKYSGLDDDFTFLEHQKNLDNIFSIADVFCLTSRMDPFPNVVIDALEHNLHIACFRHASGSVEFLEKHHADCTIVDYIDTHAMGQQIIEYLNKSHRTSSVNKKIVSKYLDFHHYVEQIESLLDDAITFNQKVNKISEFLMTKALFDPGFYNEPLTNEEACRRYVQISLKGLRERNPKPGFNELVWLEKTKNPYQVSLYKAAKEGINSTHDTVALPLQQQTTITFHYAVHLHLYYPELANEYANYFKSLPGKYDILITIVDKKDEKIAKETFKECPAANLFIKLVENIGRDSGPLFFGLKDHILQNRYEVIGHFHTKKSKDISDGIGDRWRHFLSETLLGDSHIAHSILSLFEKDPHLGLVFPEDSHVVDIGDNEDHIKNLCDMMGIKGVEQTPIFPIGNMFWARTKAIEPLFQLDPNKVLEPEPLPYDGSYMHAIERITPYLTKMQGFSWMTVHQKGVQW